MTPKETVETPATAGAQAGFGSGSAPNGLRVASTAGSPAPPPSEIPRPTGLLRGLEKGFLYLDRLIGRVVVDSLNPFLHTGALAVVTLLTATVSGVVLLIWYKPSVHLAYESVEAMSRAPLGLAGLMRSLHRYSSDAAVFFGLVHSARVLLERRFDGGRWLAWVTGSIMMGLLWFIGWTGYWLVWDLSAQSIAVGTAKMLDVLPIFADPLGRSLVTDEGVNSLLFFVVFFVHMIIPLAMGVVMWLHITRLARAHYLTSRSMSLWVGAVLLLLCIAYPATNEAPAAMTAMPQAISMDWWFLFPIPIIDRLSGGALWWLSAALTVVVLSVPWWLAKKRQEPAEVVVSRCNECKKCYTDCPYEAIEMVARSDGNSKYLTEASVIPSKCVACGICAGSCDTMGIGVDWLSTIEQRRQIVGWLKEAEAEGETLHIAFVCAESAGAALEIDPVSGRCNELPGYRLLAIPCAGWVHPLMIERAMRNGAGGVMVVTCGPGQCSYREGAEWTQQRLEGTRAPALRVDEIEPGRVQWVGLDRTRKSELIRAAARFRDGGRLQSEGARPKALTAVAAIVLGVVCAGSMGFVSDLGYMAPRFDGSEFVVSLKHPGEVGENCRDLSEEELASTPVHMRKKRVCERMRSPVRLRVVIDGETALQTRVTPSGIWEDGNSVTLERVPVEPGKHHVSLAIGETGNPDEWNFRDERTIDFTKEARRVVVFDRVAGFTWH